MAYPQRPAQRPPPLRQYDNPPSAPAAAPGYPQDGYFGQGYGDGGYGADHQYGDAGYEDAAYSQRSGSSASYRSQPRPMRPPGPPAPGYGRPPNGYDSRRGHPRDRPPPQKRSRPRRPGPGENLDNPFPSFPPKDRRAPPPRGLEKSMATMDINGRGPPQPHTSNGRRPDMRHPPPRGPPPSRGRGGYYPAGPVRSASAGRPDRPERSYTDPNGPFMPPPSRSATMPVSGDPPRAPLYPGQSTYQDPGYPLPAIGDMPPRPSTAGGLRSGRPRGNERDPTLMMPPPPDPPNRVSYAPKDFLDSYYDSHDEPDMPNFDAMPTSGRMGPIDEMGLDTPAPRSQSHPDLRKGNTPNQFENAGFQFDIPGEPSPVAAFQQDQGSDPQQNPDALPHHPVPFRPGHDQSSRPAPVRQYANAANPAQAPAAPQPMPPGEMGPTPVTHEELQRLQQQVRSNPSDQKTQLLLAKKLAEAATVLVGDNSRLDPRTKAKAKEKYVLDAYKIVKKLVSIANPDAQFYLADCYGEGLLGLEVDPKEAFQLYQSAAKQGHAQSAYRVAVCCEIGQEDGGGTKRDPFKAVHWYKRAAALGDTPAMYKMGMISLKGLLGQARSPREGVSWLKRAAERADEENPHALHELALMYQNASGNDIVVRDEQYACQLFHQAADLGYKFSQFRLGTAYEYGLMGCPVDNRISIIWYTRAAAQGEHQSELALSGWYLTGSEGILQQNDTEAYLWARKSATAGLAKAEYAMGYFTEVGIGIAANLEDAKRWYWRAAAQGFPKARERLEDLKRGGGRMQKTRLSRSAVSKQSDGDCVVM
ncbi:hypothetical protein NUU61_007357 [Penicillium alfredii]|uniref:Chitin synthase activator n=1 Tax=Penicillium alfredii TaxID=1506179 RepID=A0A9W9F2N3_9EURO|nr:uncharacterized protein NUU61_007357 [Penicillium alfredii]KAJ5092487.1 hypothetical protein NUU61_007357 [Penicillium alfredii]